MEGRKNRYKERNRQKGTSAAERLREVTEEELAGMLRENADEPSAEECARNFRAKSTKMRWAIKA